MLKEGGIDPRWDDDMKEFLFSVALLFLLVFYILMMKNFGEPYKEKTALEIKVLQHELKAYEEMDKELAE